MSRPWVHDAISRIESDFNRSADTHLIKLPSGACPDIDVYLKDESIHPTGSLKHRLARSLFLYALCNGWIDEGTPIIESSSGSTAISEAYFANLLELPFHTVIPAATSTEKIHKIEFLGGKCHLVEGDITRAAKELARELGGHYMDQFTYAERATDWRGNNNIAESLFRQMEKERYPEPTWVVVSAGTGGTSATVGRYIRYQRLDTKLCVADPENSVYAEFYRTRDRSITRDRLSRIEGIGRPHVEPSFIPDVVDRMIEVPDSAAIATIHRLERLLDRKCGGSTGTNLWAVFQIMAEMKAKREKGSIVTVICDSGERYAHTYYNAEWLAEHGLVPEDYADDLSHFLDAGSFDVS
ncbi:putative siderophore biosynthesis protein SbnA [Planctomycetes bacterium Pan216]|uniref:L-cysteine desulfhydrase Cds1 n=1 Tax=Kolteria novifilia TaxID=2527975 RepID=A0A518B150_9BACT|nr:putative siderophore biosynthesis protein SbnA [Planctomycetes bacterium Pan216]